MMSAGALLKCKSGTRVFLHLFLKGEEKKQYPIDSCLGGLVFHMWTSLIAIEFVVTPGV